MKRTQLAIAIAYGIDELRTAPLSKPDPYEGHSPNCHAVHPGDRDCNCHIAYGFATAEAMDEADAERERQEEFDRVNFTPEERSYYD